jgi:hypothetical protein
LSQALTALWDQDIKQVLDENLFNKIGIPANRWDWLPGRIVHEDKDFYPHMPGYGDFLDPPYDINGHGVRGGPGHGQALYVRVLVVTARTHKCLG